VTKPQAEALISLLITHGKAAVEDHPKPLTQSAASLDAVIRTAEALFKSDQPASDKS